MNIFKHLCIVILSVTTLSNFASQDWQDSSYKRSSSSSSSSSSFPSRSTHTQSSTTNWYPDNSFTSHASPSTHYNNSNNANQSQDIYMPSDYFSNQSQNHSDENDKNDIKLIKKCLNTIAHPNPNNPYSCPACLTNMDSNRFKALAQAAAQEIAQEVLQNYHNEIKNMNNTRSNHALTGWGITALEDNHTCAPQPQNDDSDEEDEIRTRTNSEIVHEVYAQMKLHIAQQLLPLSFHWNILPISHKAGFAAITALAVVGVYKLGSMLFGPSKQLAYDPSLVAAANNQNDQ